MITGLLVALVLLPAAVASAHAALTTSNPAAGSTVTKLPPRVELVFNEDVADGLSKLVIEDARGPRPLEGVSVSGPSVTAVLPADLVDGPVKLRYRVVSSDSHPITGDIPFTLRTGASAAGTSPAASGTPRPSGTPTTVSSAEPSSAPAVADDSSNVVMVGLMALAAVVLLVVGFLLVRSDRRQRSAWKDPDPRP